MAKSNSESEHDFDLNQVSGFDTGSDEYVTDSCPEQIVVLEPSPILGPITDHMLDPVSTPVLRRSARILSRTLKPVSDPENVPEPVLGPRSDSIPRSSARLRAKRERIVI